MLDRLPVPRGFGGNLRAAEPLECLVRVSTPGTQHGESGRALGHTRRKLERGVSVMRLPPQAGGHLSFAGFMLGDRSPAGLEPATLG